MSEHEWDDLSEATWEGSGPWLLGDPYDLGGIEITQHADVFVWLVNGHQYFQYQGRAESLELAKDRGLQAWRMANLLRRLEKLPPGETADEVFASMVESRAAANAAVMGGES